MDTTELSKGERTRQAILEAAEKLILNRGYHGSSMRNIAQQADIAVSGIYNHFASKEAIFETLLGQHQPYSNIAAKLMVLPEQDAPDLVAHVFRLMTSELAADPVFIRLAFIDLQEFKGDTLVQVTNEMIPGVLAFAERLLASGRVRQDIPIPVLMRAFAGLAIFYVLSEALVFQDDPPKIQIPLPEGIDWIGGIVDIYLNGILK